MAPRTDRLLVRAESLRSLRRRHWIGYAAAMAGTAAATCVDLGLGRLLNAGPFLSFYPAILVAALLGGWRAGAVALGLAVWIVNYAFLPPFFSWSVRASDLVATALFTLVSVF